MLKIPIKYPHVLFLSSLQCLFRLVRKSYRKFAFLQNTKLLKHFYFPCGSLGRDARALRGVGERERFGG